MSRINVNEIVGVGNTHVQILSGLIGDASQLTFPPNIVGFSPDYLEEAAEVNTNIVFTFNQPIMFRGTGSVILRSGSATGSVVQTFSITDGSPGSGLSIAGSQLIINPSSDLSYDTQYYIEITKPGIANTHGGYYPGDNTYNFKTKLIPFTATGGNYTYTKYDSDSPTNFYKYHIFTGTGPLSFSHPSSQAVDLDWMLVAGGATGGSAYSPTYMAGGGGGAGGVLTGTGPALGLNVGNYTVTIGGGGAYMPNSAAPNPSYNGNPSIIGSNQALGGGNGGGYPQPNDTYRSGRSGGSGGGGVSNPSDYVPTYYRGEASPPATQGGGTPGQGNPGGRGGFQYTPNPGQQCHAGGGGGGAGGSGGNTAYPQNPTPSRPGPQYPSSSWTGWNTTGGSGGQGKPNPAFGVANLAGYVPEPVFPLKDLLQEVQSAGYYGGGGGGGATMQPSDYYSMRAGNGGLGGGGHGGGVYTNPPTRQNPSPFLPEWPEPGPSRQYARPGHQFMGGGGGGAQAYPTGRISGQGGSGCFMLRYAVPGD